MEDEEESKFDLSQLLAEHKRWRAKYSKYNYNRRFNYPLSSTRPLVSAGANAMKKIHSSSLFLEGEPKKPSKKKSLMSKKSNTSSKVDAVKTESR